MPIKTRNGKASSGKDNRARDNTRIQNLLRPDVLARLSSLELVAKSVVEGYFTGMHRSPFFGFSQEFSEYRSYNDGDDPRFIDWNVYARTDRTYIKRFIGETNTTINLVLDVSGSMDYSTNNISKIQYGKFICSSLAYLARKQHDAIGLTLFDDSIRDMIPPSAHPDTLFRTLALLEKTKADRETEFKAQLLQLAATLRKRGIVVLVSDFYCDPEELSSQLQPLVQYGHEVALFHLLDPSERNPADHVKALRSASSLRDVETGQEVSVSAEFLQNEYPQKIRAHIEALQSESLRHGFNYTCCQTSEPLTEVLSKYLMLRQQRR